MPRTRWMMATVLAGAAYLAAGLILGELAARAPSTEMRETWRRAAWVVSAIVFGAHITYEHFRLRAAPRQSALHASAGAALATFGLAVAANVHDQPENQRALMAAMLVIWPVLVAIPAFAVAFSGAILLKRLAPSRQNAAGIDSKRLM